jgi:DNA-binding beta-propeller fold protein YncE
MRITLGSLLATVGALAAAAVIAGPASAAPGRHALFVQTDEPAGNAIVAYDRLDGGGLRRAGRYATGGRGGVLDGSVVDHLASQDSLAYDGARRLLYAVNAGSDTITTFSVHGDRLVRRQVIASGGSFPASIAVHGRLVYVLNARDGGSIQGFLRAGQRLVRIPAWRRSLHLDTDAAPEFTHTPGQVAFSPDGTRLLVTTKAGGDAIDVFGIEPGGGPSARPVVNALPGDVPFAVTWDGAGHLVASEAGPNAVESFTLRPDGTLRSIARTLTGQAATCWVVRGGSFLYASNAGSGTVSRLDATLHLLGTTATDAGTVDAVVSPDARFLYVQAGGEGKVDAFAIGRDGSLTAIGSVTVPGAVGGEGIAAS